MDVRTILSHHHCSCLCDGITEWWENHVHRYNRYAYHPRPGTPLWVSVENALNARVTAAEMTVSNTAGCKDASSTTACTSIDNAAIKAAASAADVLVFLVGTGEKIESEIVDHGIGATLKLPGQQEKLIATAKAAAPGKPVVIILFTTSPKNGPWMEDADAVIYANYPQNGGAAAIADTLLGRISPAGRLPVTWHKRWNCSIEPDPSHAGRTTGRCEILPAKLLGTNLTYRYGGSDNTLFPFGYVSIKCAIQEKMRRHTASISFHCLENVVFANSSITFAVAWHTQGLSFTNFSYSELKAPATISPCENLSLSVTVTNTGASKNSRHPVWFAI